MTRCLYASSGCNGPREGECMGLCLHRVDTHYLPDDRAAFVPGVAQENRLSVSQMAADTYRIHRPAGRLHALRQSLRVLARNT